MQCNKLCVVYSFVFASQTPLCTVYVTNRETVNLSLYCVHQLEKTYILHHIILEKAHTKTQEKQQVVCK